jgi:hypothetical protein
LGQVVRAELAFLTNFFSDFSTNPVGDAALDHGEHSAPPLAAL